jgi:hypothetical protein
MRKKITIIGVEAVAGYDWVGIDRLASGRGSFTHVGFRRFGAKPDKNLVDGQAAMPSS